MKKTAVIMIAALALFLAGCSCSSKQVKDAETTAYWTGGETVSVESGTKLAVLAGDPAQFVGKTLRLEGKVSGVCKGSGCWVELKDGAGNSFIAKSVDHTIAFPKDCEGKIAVVQGTIISQPAKGGEKAEHHDHAEHEGGEHKCPAPVYLLDLTAAELH